MEVGADEKRLVIEAIATLANLKVDMENFVLKPAEVPKEIYGPLLLQRNDLTGRRMSKRETAPLILDALEKRVDYAHIIENIVKIAAG